IMFDIVSTNYARFYRTMESLRRLARQKEKSLFSRITKFVTPELAESRNDGRFYASLQKRPLQK
ncbi:MAG: hypothetical protein ACI90V_011859, partial [Bacillariaceae sp.]